MLFDSHCHLTDDAFSGSREEVLARAREAGVVGVVCIASDPDDARAAAELAGSHDDVWCTAGIHPHAAGGAADGFVDRLREIAADPRVVAVGECGLDYHYDNAPRARQREVFRAQLELAAELDLPVVVHSRDADDDTAALVEAFAGKVRGVLHCFTAGAGLLETGLEAGWYVSFSGIVTFDSYGDGPVVARVPADRLLVETDSPYLAPIPHRGKRNEPAHVARVAEKVAELRGATPGEIGRITTENARRFYRLAGT